MGSCSGMAGARWDGGRGETQRWRHWDGKKSPHMDLVIRRRTP